MIKQLVVNGCSYMYNYADGGGHWDLALRLGIPKSESLAVMGSCNSRIIRTTLKHSYATTMPTLYVLGITFISRSEIAAMREEQDFEGRWRSLQSVPFSDDWQFPWTDKDTKNFIDLNLKLQSYNFIDRLEDLMYRLLSLVRDLESRGHRVIMYQQADDIYQELLDHPKLVLFKNNPAIIDGLNWRAVAWQINQGAGVLEDKNIPYEMQHIAPGEHKWLNRHLHEHIKNNNIL